jgi:hypothetical protein
MRASRTGPTWLVLAVAAAAACSSDGPTPPNGGPAGTITVTLSGSSLAVLQGTIESFGVTIARGGGFNGAVTLAVEGAPAGVDVVISPGTIPAGETAAIVSLAIAPTVGAGSYTLTVRARGQGARDGTATLGLSVDAPPTGGFVLALSPAAIDLLQGGVALVGVNITRSGGFTGEIEFSLLDAPAGLTGTFEPARTTGAGSSLRLQAATTLAGGTYTPIVRGRAAGLSDQSVALTVQVAGGGGTGTNVVWQFCEASGLPLLVAFQDGTGAWTKADGIADTYTFPMAATRGGVAWILEEPPGRTRIEVRHGSIAELAALGAALCSRGLTRRTVAGTVSGLGAGDIARIAFGPVGTTVTGTTSFSIERALPGGSDLAAGRAVPVAGGFALDRIVLRRSVGAGDGSVGAVDFGGVDAFAPVERGLTIANLGADETRVEVGLTGTAFATAPYFAEPAGVAGGTRTYPAVPDDRIGTRDLQQLRVVAAPAGAGPAETRSASVFFRNASDRTVTLGPALGAVTVTAAAASPLRPRVQYTTQAEYARWFEIVFDQAGRSARIGVGPGWVQGGTIDAVLPDLAGLEGWQAAWGLTAGPTTWTATAAGWSAATGTAEPPVTDGGAARSASRTGPLVP